MNSSRPLLHLELKFLDIGKHEVQILPVTDFTRAVSPRRAQRVGALHKIGNTFIQPFGNVDLASSLKPHSQLKGLVKEIENSFVRGSKSYTYYKCKYFTLNYYPPSHFLSLFRKSKPAVSVTPTKKPPAIFNGKLLQNNIKQEDLALISRIYSDSRKQYPRNYSFWRRNSRRILRDEFQMEWCALYGHIAVDEQIAMKRALTSEKTVELKDYKWLDDKGRTKIGVSKDGFYSYQLHYFPVSYNWDEFLSELRKSVRVVAYLKWKKFECDPNTKKKSNQNVNDSVNIDRFNRILEEIDMPIRLVRTRNIDTVTASASDDDTTNTITADNSSDL
ncbi:Pet130p NDAI_0C02820 [Naumovozyma dairenensis CBS 421]|uniref:Uncharacterized protein n=1 Tax=Naumovozyma dairenensis (strain ATCC 10597 / BCRC 20456 / CBS 421 / NBRC 0211 / NRRL Y-12639) TaxID=1071378 RepID=G0W831_NAUDC|nr:hypothetical protein NDAI_0C02820 [Naumovozyma dairenensis CBS 421]CCD23942.1 hypothetical protein NDAI_0C02820 [Naumovozyma dairenensis CBS 421]